MAVKYGLTIIEDAAHALGTTYKGKKVGSISDMTTFSLHPVKHITTGEGGVITTNDEGFYKRLLMFRTHGITRDESLFTHKGQGAWYYEQLELGYNYRITDIQCALGMSQLKKIEPFIQKRRDIVKQYHRDLASIDGIILPYESAFSDSSWHLYIVQLELEKFTVGRKEIFEALQAENIGVNIHYIPVYYHPYYRQLGYKKGLCPNAESLYEKIITLPLFPMMETQDAEDVVTAVKKVLDYYRKA